MKNDSFMKRWRAWLTDEERNRIAYLESTLATLPKHQKQLFTKMYYREQGLRLVQS